jgi:hypothetical protein
MVSAKAGVGPIYAISRTAAAAPVTNFAPRIPSIPFISFASSSTLKPRQPLDCESVSPRTIFWPQARRNPALAKPEWKLWTCSIRATLFLHSGILAANQKGDFNVRQAWKAAQAKKRRLEAAQIRAKSALSHRKASDSRIHRGNGSLSWPGAASSSRKRRPAGHPP